MINTNLKNFTDNLNDLAKKSIATAIEERGLNLFDVNIRECEICSECGAVLLADDECYEKHDGKPLCTSCSILCEACDKYFTENEGAYDEHSFCCKNCKSKQFNETMKNKKIPAKYIGLQTLSVTELLELSTLLKVKISDIKQSIYEENRISILDDDYKVVHKDEVESEMKNYFYLYGKIESILCWIQREIISFDFEKLISEAGVNLIKNKSKFAEDCRNYLKRDFDDYANDYKNFEEYLKEQQGLEVEDLQNPAVLWEREVLYTGYPKHFKEEMLPIIKEYEIDEDYVFKKMFESNTFSDFETLGDYGKAGKFVLSEHNLYRVDR